jgi:O-methyltransferase
MQPLARGVRRYFKRRALSLDEPYYTVYPYTQVHPVRQQNIVRLAQRVDEQKVEGALVECGVLDGGQAGLMAWATANSSPPRSIHLFDAWEGLPPPSAQDGAEASRWEGQVVGSPARVRRVMKKLRVDPSRLHFHKGWFQDVFPHVQIEKIALLHIDPDFYDAVKLCLDRWYPHVTPGGYIQIDDYAAFSGCHRAVNEFLEAHPDVQLETTGEFTKAYFFRKPLLPA